MSVVKGHDIAPCRLFETALRVHLLPTDSMAETPSLYGLLTIVAEFAVPHSTRENTSLTGTTTLLSLRRGAIKLRLASRLFDRGWFRPILPDHSSNSLRPLLHTVPRLPQKLFRCP